MSISADKMKDAPAWATRYETTDDESGGWFARDLTKPTTIATATGSQTGRAQLILDSGNVYVVDNATDQQWSNPGQMRMLAAHLLNAADAWDELRTAALNTGFVENLNRCMTAADVDVAGLADRTEIPVARLEAILSGKAEVGMAELVMFAEALDVSPSELLPTPRDV
ncbi:helix-turn-helix domain-containing protein [Demequina lutea]|uniref:HTH cro/C1-type domain-containing protein n=1 Tax=Demequina lutea TaxID=431489 RepID=A0A7Y9Z9W6_9MICO|nr:helix-turn-helix transcriptional regulator [Demequina lutea]NYI41497.1 hypothetical protein [Demequina lutea]